MKQIAILFIFLLCTKTPLFCQGFDYFFKTIGADTINTFLRAGISVEDGFLAVGTYTSVSHKALYLHKIDLEGRSIGTQILRAFDLEQHLSMSTGDLLIRLNNDFLIAYNKSTEEKSIDIGIIKFDKEGEILWEREFGDERDQTPFVLLETKDGGFIVGGLEAYVPNVTPFQYWTMYVVKADSLGNQQWEQRYTLDEGNNSFIFDIIETLDGGYLLGGYGHVEEDFAGAYQQEAYVVKIDSLGNAQWEKSYGTLDWDDSAVGVYQCPDSTYLLYGSEGGRESMFNYLMFRHIDQGGNTLEENTYEEWYTTGTWRLFPLEDGGFLGFANHRLKKNAPVRPRMMRLTPYGRDTLWTKVIDYLPGMENLGIRDVDQTNDGGYIITGFRTSPFPQFGWVLKVDSLGNGCFEFGCDSSTITHIEEFPKSEQKRFSLYPNPTQGEVTVQFYSPFEGGEGDVGETLKESELVVRDVSGKVLKKMDLVEIENGSFENFRFLSVDDLEAGIYFVDWQLNGKSLGVEKLVVY
ncbi:MAG: T9SS type A sorting domain-containing protein [Chitinophagales bacterium]